MVVGDVRTVGFIALVLWSASCGGREWLRGEQNGELLPADSNWIEAKADRPTLAVRTVEVEMFRNTYYDFPSESGGTKDATLFDASCQTIAQVPTAFHDAVCLQGSGRLATGETVSFAKRDCPCARVCPRSGSRICFEKLDPKLFPTGRGAAGKPVVPLRTIAVDTNVIPLGEVVFIKEFSGVQLPDGQSLDGCFKAEDRGSKVVGRHVDVFTGSPSMTRVLNDLVPSNQGVSVDIGAARCRHLK